MTDKPADTTEVIHTSTLPRLDGDAIGKRVRHRTFWTEVEGVVVAQTDDELKVRRWPWVYRWVPRLCTLEVSR